MNSLRLLTIATLMLIPWAMSAIAAETNAAKAYPLQTCLVSGEKLDNSDKDVVVVREGQELKFCCRKCLKKFQADPAKYMQKLASTPAPAESEKTPSSSPADDHSNHQH